MMIRDRDHYIKNRHSSAEYHRAYRMLHYGNLTGGILLHLILFLIIASSILLCLEKLTFFYSSTTAVILRNSIPELKLATLSFLGNDLWLLQGKGLFPSDILLVITSLGSIIVWLLVTIIKKIPLPITLSVKVLCALNIIGCLYFYLWGDHFPYDLNNFSNLYLSAEIGMWIALPFMMIFALLPVPVSIFAKAGLVFVTIAYTYCFGMFRYAICLYILAKFTYLWMAILYFGVVVFFDFACMIAFYSYFISLVAPKIVLKRGIWRWLYSS